MSKHASNQSKRAFVQGVAIVCAEMIRSFDEPTMAADIITGFGYTLADLESAKVDDYDLDVLRPHLATPPGETAGKGGTE